MTFFEYLQAMPWCPMLPRTFARTLLSPIRLPCWSCTPDGVIRDADVSLCYLRIRWPSLRRTIQNMYRLSVWGSLLVCRYFRRYVESLEGRASGQLLNPPLRGITLKAGPMTHYDMLVTASNNRRGPRERCATITTYAGQRVIQTAESSALCGCR
jgi:hypothetical protein